MPTAEDLLTIQLMDYVRRRYPKAVGVFYHIPNGGFRKITTARLLKRMGVLPGVSDFFCMQPRGEYSGLYLELKTEEGRLSEDQKTFLFLAQNCGYMALPVWGEVDAKDVIDMWLGCYGRPEDYAWRMGLFTESKRRKEGERRRARKAEFSGSSYIDGPEGQTEPDEGF